MLYSNLSKLGSVTFLSEDPVLPLPVSIELSCMVLGSNMCGTGKPIFAGMVALPDMGTDIIMGIGMYSAACKPAMEWSDGNLRIECVGCACCCCCWCN